MKTIYLFYSIGAIALVFSCKSGTSVKQETCSLAGRYINYTVLQHCPDILPGDVPSYALEMQIKSKDTVDISNGFERFHLPFTGPVDGCNYMISGATQYGDMHFMVQGDSTIQLFDSAWTKLKTASVFRRIDESKPWTFIHYLNECVISGTWSLVKKGVNEGHRVTFVRNGQVDDMKPYLSYKICYAGDCLEETDPHSNTIDFMDDHGKYTTFSFKIAPGRRLIQFYNIDDPVADMKGGRKIGSLAFEIRK